MPNETGNGAARKHFRARVRDKVIFLADMCMPATLRAALDDLNELVIGGRGLGVTEALPFPEDELNRLAEELGRKRASDKMEALRFLVGKLIKQGVADEVFKGFPRPVPVIVL